MPILKSRVQHSDADSVICDPFFLFYVFCWLGVAVRLYRLFCWISTKAALTVQSACACEILTTLRSIDIRKNKSYFYLLSAIFRLSNT